MLNRFIALAVLLLICVHSSIASADETRPNFILCMADDQGWGDMGYNGHPHLKTPVFDEMAATGLRLDRFYSAAPACSPTRGSVLTGRNPNRFGCFSWGRTLRPQEVTIALHLQRAGYATAHFGKWHLGDLRTDSPVNPGAVGFTHWISSPNNYEHDPLFADHGRVFQAKGESSMATIEIALPFLRDVAKSKQPFLAVIWFGNPHRPHHAHEDTIKDYVDFPLAEQNYYAEITGIDRAMGRLREELDALGIRDNTLLWYTSDNGQQAQTVGSSGGLRGAKATLWEGGIRVPTIIEWPARIHKPRITNVPSNTCDILPTLLELAGLPIPTDRPLDGVSLAGVIDGTMNQRQKPMGFWWFADYGYVSPDTETLRPMLAEQQGKTPVKSTWPLSPVALLQKKFSYDNLRGHAAWIDGDMKLHRIPSKDGSTATLELYDLGADPAETTNIAEKHPELVEQYERDLLTWQRSVIDSLNGKDY